MEEQKEEKKYEIDFNRILPRQEYDAFRYSVPGLQYCSPEITEISGDFISMSVADLDFQTAPEIVDAFSKRIDHRCFGYTTFPDRSKQAIVSWYDRQHNKKIQSQDITLSSSGVHSLRIVYRALLKEGQAMLDLTPVYHYCHLSAIMNNRGAITSELIKKNNRFQINFEDMEDQLKKNPQIKMFLFCNPHNPSGRVYTHQEVLRLAQLCIKYDLLVCSDEIFCDTIINGKHVLISDVLEQMKDRTVIINSPSKTFGLSGLFSSYMIITNQTLRDKILQEFDITGFFLSNLLSYQIFYTAYEKCQYWIKLMLNYVYQNFQYLKQQFNTHIPQAAVFDLDSAFLVYVDFQNCGFTTQEMKSIFKAANVSLQDLKLFHFPESSRPEVRINIATSIINVENAVKRICQAYQDFQATKQTD